MQQPDPATGDERRDEADEEGAEDQHAHEEAKEQAEAARAVAGDAVKAVKSLEGEVHDEFDKVWAAIEGLQDGQLELKDRTDLLTAVRQSSATSRDEKAAICLQTLVNNARQREERGEPATAYLTASEGVAALGGGVDRTTLYPVFERAQSLVDDTDVCEYVTEPTGSNPPSRLVVDLDAGQFPSVVAGHEIETDPNAVMAHNMER